MSWIYLTELMKVGKWMWFHLFKPIPTERAELWLRGELLSPSYGNVLPWCSWALRTWRSQTNPMSKNVWMRHGLLGNVVDGWTGWSQRSFPAFTIPWLCDSALGCVHPYLFVFIDNLFGRYWAKAGLGDLWSKREVHSGRIYVPTSLCWNENSPEVSWALRARP